SVRRAPQSARDPDACAAVRRRAAAPGPLGRSGRGGTAVIAGRRQLRYHHPMRFLPAVALLAAIASCGPSDEVRRYKAPKDPTWRMIGGIVTAKDSTWFFKVAAPTDRITATQAEILSFLRGLRIEEAEVKWPVPEGWKEEKGGPARVATLKFGDREPKLELTISK